MSAPPVVSDFGGFAPGVEMLMGGSCRGNLTGMLGSVIAALFSAFITGALARFAVPGPDPMPAWLTIAIGLVGTVIGGGIVLAVAGPDEAWVGIAGFLTSIALVVAYRRFVQKRALWGPEAYRFPQKGVGVEQYRERLQKAGIDPNAIGSPFVPTAQPAAASKPTAPVPAAGDPTENPAHYLTLLEELHDSGVLDDDEYNAARTRLLERLRA
jgi:uncharacterized membrane protein YeaQ/YmgE (transglycosylase-associated protein family)